MPDQQFNSPELNRNNRYQKTKDKITEIETELRRLGRWQDKPLSPETLNNMGAFGMRTMTLEQWIQFILIPRVHEIIKKKDDFPLSQLAVYATKNLDGDHDGAKLLKLIQEFDTIVNDQ